MWVSVLREDMTLSRACRFQFPHVVRAALIVKSARDSAAAWLEYLLSSDVAVPTHWSHGPLGLDCVPYLCMRGEEYVLKLVSKVVVERGKAGMVRGAVLTEQVR